MRRVRFIGGPWDGKIERDAAAGPMPVGMRWNVGPDNQPVVSDAGHHFYYECIGPGEDGADLMVYHGSED